MVRHMSASMPEKLPEKLFVISTIGDGERRQHADRVLKNILRPAAELVGGVEVLRGDQDTRSGEIMRQVVDSILDFAVVACVIFEENPNVFYEAGVAHAAGRRLLILKYKSFTKMPFDVLGQRYIEYDQNDLKDRKIARREGVPGRTIQQGTGDRAGGGPQEGAVWQSV